MTRLDAVVVMESRDLDRMPEGVGIPLRPSFDLLLATTVRPGVDDGCGNFDRESRERLLVSAAKFPRDVVGDVVGDVRETTEGFRSDPVAAGAGAAVSASPIFAAWTNRPRLGGH